VPHQIIQSWYTGRWRVGCYIWYSEEGPWRVCSPPRPLLAVPNITAHPSMASVPITALLYDCLLLSCSAVLMWRLKGSAASRWTLTLHQPATVQPSVTVRSLLPVHERGTAYTIWHSNIYTIIRHVQETSEILPLSTVFLQPVELVTTCTLTMLGALEVVRAAYCAL